MMKEKIFKYALLLISIVALLLTINMKLRINKLEKELSERPVKYIVKDSKLVENKE